MAATSALARLGLRIATLGSAANLAIAAPIAEGDVSPTAHTDATRVGVYFDRTAPANPFIGFVAGGVEGLRVAKTAVSTLIKLNTVASAAVAGAGFNLAPGVAPNTPANGDVWVTGVGSFVRAGGVTRNLTSETYTASVSTEAQLAAAITAAEASNYPAAVIFITSNLALTTNGVPGMTKDYTLRGVAGPTTGLKPVLTKNNGPWSGFSGNLTLINLDFVFAATTGVVFYQDGHNTLTCIGCSFTTGGGQGFFQTDYEGSLTAEFRNCTVVVTGVAPLLFFNEGNPLNFNIPQSTVLFNGCALSGSMVNVTNGGKVWVTLVGSSLTNNGSGCWFATEASVGRTSLTVNYDSTKVFSSALVAGSTDPITFTDNAAYPGGGAALTNTYVGVGNGSNLLSGSASLRYATGTLTATRADAGDAQVSIEAGTGATTARAILFLRGNVGDSTTGWFFIRNGTTVGSHLDLVYTPSANINDGANKHAMRVYTDGGVQIGGVYGTSPGAGALSVNRNGIAGCEFFGRVCGNTGSTGANCTGLGVNALIALTTAQGITAVGFNSLNTLSTGDYNTAVGVSALALNSTGSLNTAVGVSALQDALGSNNTAIGAYAGLGATGDDNTFVGQATGLSSAALTGTTVIGKAALATKSNQTVIGGVSTVETVLFGKVLTPASTATRAGINIAHGVAPTTPDDGDFWSVTTTGLFTRFNGVTALVTLNLGVPSGEAGDRTLTNADNAKNLICTGSRTFTVNTGLVAGFGCSFKGTVAFAGTATITDVRTTGAANPWCALCATGTDTYDIVGSKA